MPWDAKQTSFGQLPGSDDQYRDFCARFFRLYDACNRQRLSVTVKGLDSYLWQVPV